MILFKVPAVDLVQHVDLVQGGPARGDHGEQKQGPATLSPALANNTVSRVFNPQTILFKVPGEAPRRPVRRSPAPGDVQNDAEICITYCQCLSADVAHTTMPKPTSTASGDRKPPVPVGLLLPLPGLPHRRPHRRRPTSTAPDLPDWNGLTSATVAHLICHYTRLGDVVVDLDEHPIVIEAARHLRRAAARLVLSQYGPRVRLVPPPPAGRWPRRVVRRPGPGADLIFATLPRPEADTLDLHAMTTAMSTWRPLLRPGGILLALLTTSTPQPDQIGHRSTVVVAARAAGLLYHQHIPYLLAPAPQHEPRTAPEPQEADDGRRLLAGRHVPAYRDLLAFAGTAPGEEATRG